MRRLAVLLAAAAAALAGSAQAATFTVVPGDFELPTAEVPNGPGSIVQPASISTPPERPAVLSFEQLLDLWREAGGAYGVPWELLASINQIESDFGRNMGPSHAGAVGWMQFLPSTWDRWGLDANGDGVADPWNPTDAVYAAARYLVAAGAHGDLRRAVFAYNHSDEYVDQVMAGAARFAADPLAAGLGFALERTGPTPEELEAELAAAGDRAAGLVLEIAELGAGLEQSAWQIEAAKRDAGNPSLSDGAFADAQARLAATVSDRDGVAARLEAARAELAETEAEVARLEEELALAHAETAGGSLDGLLPAAPTPAAQRVIDFALGQLGVPYRWGGNHGFSLDQMIELEPRLEYGFDCSSLLAWAYAKGAGIYIGDWTVSQWEYGATAPGATRGAGPAQGGADPAGGYLPGDLIFFNDTDHVAMYLGGDLFVHAPRTGDVVRIARLSQYGPVWGWVRYAALTEEPDAETGEDGRVFDVVTIERG